MNLQSLVVNDILLFLNLRHICRQVLNINCMIMLFDIIRNLIIAIKIVGEMLGIYGANHFHIKS